MKNSNTQRGAAPLSRLKLDLNYAPTSVCIFSGEIILVKMMAGAPVIRTEKSVKMGVMIALLS